MSNTPINSLLENHNRSVNRFRQLALYHYLVGRTDATIKANFAINTFTLTYNAGTNGLITGTTLQNVNYGSNGTQVTAVPNVGCRFIGWDDGVLTASRMDTNVTGNKIVTASFATNTFTLAYNAGSNGSITGTTPQVGNYGFNGTGVTAVPDANYHFIGWNDGILTASRTDTNITSNKTIIANFALNTYTLTYNTDGNGSITGIASQTVNYGSDGAEVTAVPSTGYRFVSWDDGVLIASRKDANVTENKTATAIFSNIYNLIVNNGIGGGAYAYGTVVGISADAPNGKEFNAWTGDTRNVSDVNANPANLTMPAKNVTITASYKNTGATSYPLTVYSGFGNGLYSEGTTVNIVADPPPTINKIFDRWTGDVTSVENVNSDSSTINMPASSASVTATYKIKTFTVNFIGGTNGTINGTKVQTINYDSSTDEVTADPAYGYHFLNWTGDYLGTINPLTISNVISDKTVTANFAINTYTLTYSADTGGKLTGSTSQSITHGANGTPVQAVPNSDYMFSGWSDGVMDNPRTDLGVTASKSVSANFSLFSILTDLESVNIPEGKTAVFKVKLSAKPAVSKKVTVNRVSGDPDITVPYVPEILLMETFESETLPQWLSVDGSSPLASHYALTTEKKHSGNKSLKMFQNNSNIPAGGELIEIYNRQPMQAQYGNWSFYWYDDSPDGNLFDFYIQTGGIEIREYDCGDVAKSQKYFFGQTQVPRSLGWHKIEIRHAIEKNQIYMDDVLREEISPGTMTTGIHFRLFTHHPGTGATYIDDLSFSSPGLGLTFTTENWDTYQNVTLNAAEDVDNINGAATIRCSSSGMSDKDITAVEIDNDYVLTTNAVNGIIQKNPSLAVYSNGAVVQLTATPNDKYHFTEWSGDLSGTQNPSNLTMGSNKDVTANFEHDTASLIINNSGKVTTEFTVANQMDTFTVIPIVATADASSHFMNWTVASGDVTIENANSASTTVTLNGAHGSSATITANFAINSYTVNFNAGANGTITGIKTQTVNHGSPCTMITTIPILNYHFSGWSGAYTGIDNPITNITKSMTVTANFARNTATLAVNKSGNGTAGFSLVNPVNTATVIPITANAYANNHFVNWIVTGSATIANLNSASTAVTLTGGHGSTVTVTANFAEDIAATVIPAAPVISATDGTYVDRVVVTWKAVSGATSYGIYRNNLNSTAGAILIGETTDTIFEDSSAEFNTVYYYFAKAKNSVGDSEYSFGNSGYVAKAPAVPGVVIASDGTYFDKIRVSWAKVTGATSYRVFRTETDTPAPNPALDTNLIGETTALFLDDFGDKIAPPPGDVAKKYYYWIAAKNGNATSAISSSNSGYLSKKGPATVSASNGTYSEKIVVTWAAVPGATGYDVYRYADAKFTQNPTKVGDAVAGLECVDSTVTLNTPYYYKVKAKYGSGDPPVHKYDSDFSIAGAVGKASGSFDPKGTALFNGVQVSNIANLLRSSAYYSIDVPVGTTRMVATLDGTSSLTPRNDCDLFAKFANFPTLTSYNAKGVENKFNEILTVSNPSAGIWYFLLYGYTAYSGVSLTVDYYSVADIVLTQIPVNDLAVPFTAVFKGQVVDEIRTGIPNIVVQTRNPITGLTSSLARTDAKGIFSYSALIGTEGEHTFDFFFMEIPDKSKGTASHTVATRKGCLEANNFFDFSAYLPATPVALPLQDDIVGLQTFLDIRNGWDFLGTVNAGDTYETLWINSTIAKVGDDAQLRANLDGGLYMFFYGVEGVGVGNDTSTVSALSAVPFVVHVESTERDGVLDHLKDDLGVITLTQYNDIKSGKTGIVAVASLSNPDEATDGNYNISMIAREQLEILAKIAGGVIASSADAGTYSGLPVKKIAITLDSTRKINIVATVFVK